MSKSVSNEMFGMVTSKVELRFVVLRSLKRTRTHVWSLLFPRWWLEGVNQEKVNEVYSWILETRLRQSCNGRKRARSFRDRQSRMLFFAWSRFIGSASVTVPISTSHPTLSNGTSDHRSESPPVQSDAKCAGGPNNRLTRLRSFLFKSASVSSRNAQWQWPYRTWAFSSTHDSIGRTRRSCALT